MKRKTRNMLKEVKTKQKQQQFLDINLLPP